MIESQARGKNLALRVSPVGVYVGDRIRPLVACCYLLLGFGPPGYGTPTFGVGLCFVLVSASAVPAFWAPSLPHGVWAIRSSPCFGDPLYAMLVV